MKHFPGMLESSQCRRSKRELQTYYDPSRFVIPGFLLHKGIADFTYYQEKTSMKSVIPYFDVCLYAQECG